MTSDFQVPKEVADALAAFDAQQSPIDEFLVQGELATVAKGLGEPSEAERRGLAAEGLAFSFVGQNGKTSLWRTHFGPMMTREDHQGNFICSPDIRGVSAATVQYWTMRAGVATHPVLKARYADLAWDLARAVGAKAEVNMAHTAIDAYAMMTIPKYRDGLHARLIAGIRGFDLAMQIKDHGRAAAARQTLLVLHAEAISNKEPVWWVAPTRLLRDNRTGLSDAQKTALIADLETLVTEFGNIGDPKRFNPHDLENAAGLLERYYRRHGTEDDIKRLREAVGRGFEAAAGLGDAMVAPAFLQSAIDAYRGAGMKDDAARGRKLMEEAIQTSNKAMKSIGTPIEYRREDVDTFVAGILDDDLFLTLAKLANAFLARKTILETQLQESARTAPLQAMIPKKIMQDDHVAATVGSIKDDPAGRLVDHASMHFALEALWLMAALEGAIEKHEYTADHFAAWTNRLGLFDDLTFLKEGFAAWLGGDDVKALHVLVPQAERGLRAIADAAGVPVTKAHPVTQDASVSINMGDILSSEKILAFIGEDMALHFRALYADPRGMNLRNRVAHGLYSPRSLNPHIVRLVVHSLLVLGVWKDIVTSRAKPKS